MWVQIWGTYFLACCVRWHIAVWMVGIMISAVIPYLFPHLLYEQRTLVRHSALRARSTSSFAAFMHFIIIGRIYSSLVSLFFSPPRLTRVCMFFFARTETKCHRKLKWKVKAESSASFQREPGNKGSLWSSRVTLLSALIRGLDQSEPPPLFSMLFSQAWQANCTQFLSQGLAGGPHSNSDLAVVTVTPEYYRKFSWGWFRVTLWLNSGFFNHIFWLLLELAHELMCLVGDGVWMNRND